MATGHTVQPAVTHGQSFIIGVITALDSRFCHVRAQQNVGPLYLLSIGTCYGILLSGASVSKQISLFLVAALFAIRRSRLDFA